MRSPILHLESSIQGVPFQIAPENLEKCMKHSESDIVMYRLGDEIYGIRRLKLMNEMVKYRLTYNDKGNILYLIPYTEFINITKKIK